MLRCYFHVIRVCRQWARLSQRKTLSHTYEGHRKQEKHFDLDEQLSVDEWVAMFRIFIQCLTQIWFGCCLTCLLSDVSVEGQTYDAPV